MVRRRSEYKQGEETPVFKFYKNRKTYFRNDSRYVSHAEVREIIANSKDGEFSITGISKEKFLMKILSTETEVGDAGLLYRSVMHGGFIDYIRHLEASIGISQTIEHTEITSNTSDVLSI